MKHFTWRGAGRVVGLLWFVGSITGVQGIAQRRDEAHFQSGVELVHLHVTVTDPEGQFRTGLSRDAFAVFEDGVRQTPVFFLDGGVPD